MLTTGENGVNVLFQGDVSALFRIVDNARSGGLGSKLQTLENSLVILGIVYLAGLLKLLGLCLIVLEGVLQVIVQSGDGVMLRGRGLLLLWLEVDLNLVADREIGKNFILLIIIVVLCPALFKDDSALKREFLVVADLNFDLGLLRKAILRAENGNETTENGGINLIFLLGELLLRGNFIGRSEGGVRLNLGVVENSL